MNMPANTRPDTGITGPGPAGGEIAALSREEAALIARVTATGRYSSINPFLVQALTADTIEEATAIGDVIQGGEHLNERIRYFGVTFLDSDPELDSDIPIFAVCDVVREMGDGAHERMSIGAGHVVGVLIRAAEQGWFPFDAELVAVGLGAGRKAINLQLAPTKVESTTEF